jgi:SAM-dependent methyltransferase
VNLQLEQIARRWSEQLNSWALPEDRLRAMGYKGTPWKLDPETFKVSDQVLTPSHKALLRLLNKGSQRSVMDVGAGAGGAVLPVGSSVSHLIAVDQSQEMLDVFKSEAARIDGLTFETVLGNFLEVEGLPVVDVVTCHHMIYNVGDLVGLLAKVVAHARVGVVLELTLCHPMYSLNELWRHFWDLERPSQPTAATVIELLYVLGFEPEIVLYSGPKRGADQETRIDSIVARLGLETGRRSEVIECIKMGMLLENPSLSLSFTL